MLHVPERGGKSPSIAVICFIPDYGHLQPLLKIADALRQEGFYIKCYLAAECVPLLRRFNFDYFALESTSGQKKESETARAFSRSTFFNTVCLYLHYLLIYPRVCMAVGQAAPKLRAELAEQQPDLIISDVLWFGAWYERIAQWLGCPLVKNSLDGSLAYNQRPFVQIYGVSKVSPLAQLVVERAASTSRTLCSSFYRMRYFRDWLGLLSIRRKAAAKFKAAFPIDDECPPNTHCIVTGTARLERDRLATLLELKGADRREFSALMFRSRVRVPDDLWNWIRSDTSRSIVYVSFGSAVDIDAKFARTIYEALRLVDARVLWSLPAHQRALLPAGELTDENIRFESFVPQPEVLGLSAVRCFLTQGGPHSVQEALFGATPMVCIPFFADQAYNSSVIQRLHVGRRLWRRKISAESLAGTINEILHNPDYLRAAIEISEVLAKNEGGSAIAEYVRGLLTSRSRAI